MQCEGLVWAFLTGGEGAPPTIAAIHGGSGTRRNLTLWNLSTRKATPTDQTLIGYRVGLIRGKPALLTLHQRREPRWLAIEAGAIVSRPATDVGEKPDMQWARLYPKLRYFCDAGGEEIALLQPETKGLSVVRLRTGRKIGKDFTRVATTPFSAPAVLDANPDGARLWVPSGRDIEALPLTATGRPRTTLRGSRAAVGQLALLEWRGTKSLVSIDAENVRVWDLRDTDLEQHAHAWRHGRPDTLFAITQKGRTTLVVSAGEQTILSDAHDGTELRVIEHQGFSGTGLSVDRLGAMNVLVAADATGVVRLFDCDSGEAIGQPMRHDNEGDDDVSVAGFARLDGRDVLVTV
ncbi:MAG: hypothetical protein ABIU95_11330 [Burkholderiales bacterium]